MKLDVKITNLGMLESATIKVRPMTVLTGPNGTGKSFFTKTLYSLLNVVNRNVFHEGFRRDISIILFRLDSIKSKNLRDMGDLQVVRKGLDILQSELVTCSNWGLKKYLDFANSRVNSIGDLLDSIGESKPSTVSEAIFDNLNALKKQLEECNSVEYFNNQITLSLFSELIDNFQISDLKSLITFEKNELAIVVDELINIHINQDGIGALLGEAFLEDVSSLSTVVFFESPAYWKVKDALQYAAQRVNDLMTNANQNEILTGVPKYFYDLDQALKSNIKSSGSNEISELTSSIKEALGGEFVFNGDNLIFKDSKTGREISKNLISFGMTNLGMIHTLLKNNVITKGSFVFIDEPETNLHPNWQVLLMNTLIKLAEHEVNVVIATHSADMLKALEVGMKKRKDKSDDDFMAIHYLDTDGQLLDFDSDRPMMQLAEARSALNSTFESLYFEGCADD